MSGLKWLVVSFYRPYSTAWITNLSLVIRILMPRSPICPSAIPMAKVQSNTTTDDAENHKGNSGENLLCICLSLSQYPISNQGSAWRHCAASLLMTVSQIKHWPDTHTQTLVTLMHGTNQLKRQHTEVVPLYVSIEIFEGGGEIFHSVSVGADLWRGAFMST